MRIYPAIDVLGGQAVRLKQGRATDVTVYGNPLEMAEKWVSRGAEWLHVVDLDGAFDGKPKNAGILRQMSRSVAKRAKIQAGGGIRDMNAVETFLDAGIERVVLGTAAVEDPGLVREALTRYGERIAIAIDAKEGKAKIAGWTKDSSIGAIELAQQLQRLGARLIIYTDIARDGVLEGPNIESTRALIENTKLEVIASGGISSINDVQRLAGMAHPRLHGAIIGKALYEGRILLEEALACAG